MPYKSHQATEEEQKNAGGAKNIVVPKTARYAATCIDVIDPIAKLGNDAYKQTRGVVTLGFKFELDAFEEGTVAGWCNIPFNFDAFDVREWLKSQGLEKTKMPDEYLEQYGLPLLPPKGKNKGHKLYIWGRALGCFYKVPRAGMPDYEEFDPRKAIGHRVWLTLSPLSDNSGSKVEAVEVDMDILNSKPPERAPKPATQSANKIQGSGFDNALIEYFQELGKAAQATGDEKLAPPEIAKLVRSKFDLGPDGKPKAEKPMFRYLPHDKQVEVAAILAGMLVEKVGPDDVPAPADKSASWVGSVLPWLEITEAPEAEMEF